jgi:hypothetical protein
VIARREERHHFFLSSRLDYSPQSAQDTIFSRHADYGGTVKQGIDLYSIAREIKAAQDQCRQIEPFTSRLRDFGNAEAYAVAHLIHEMRMKEGAIPVGRKIGFTNPEMWSIYGVC